MILFQSIYSPHKINQKGIVSVMPHPIIACLLGAHVPIEASLSYQRMSPVDAALPWSNRARRDLEIVRCSFVCSSFLVVMIYHLYRIFILWLFLVQLDHNSKEFWAMIILPRYKSCVIVYLMCQLMPYVLCSLLKIASQDISEIEYECPAKRILCPQSNP